MPEYYLRVEGVNLSAFLHDTNDLSTVRGGSLLLLHSVNWIEQEIKTPKLSPVTTGASSGIFRFEAADENAAQAAVESIQTKLRNDPKLSHATFVVNVVKATDDFIVDRERLIALNRFSQMQSATIVVPPYNSEVTRNACLIDRRRPASMQIQLPEQPAAWVSESVAVRRDWGKTQKQKFYQDQTEIQIARSFANDFDELSEDEARGNLRHKMALIYLDGNGFGKLQNELCRTAKDQERFDVTLRSYRREMLKALISKMESEPEDWFTLGQQKKFRLETLLWGGDEIVWVVPAWQGWKTLAFFYSQSQEWNFDGQPLLHAGGLVFCQHNAPIQRIKELAHSLAELAKKKDRHQNLFAYEVLESFDHIGRDLDDYRRERSPDRHSQTLILTGDSMDKTLERARYVLERLSTRQLHRVVRKILRTRSPLSNAEHLEAAKGLDGAGMAHLHALTNRFGGLEARWLHLAALRDYLL
jgi:hypothetical protein